ncbi:MAG: hypothetical protein M0R21_09425 [Lentimicrobiaceae bacterium]|nr:hypothetical protein [Lentimicrobiaceae bacterium]
MKLIMKPICFILIAFISLPVLIFSQDKTPFPARGGVGVQGGISIFAPKDLNDFTQDFWDNLTNKFYSYGYDGSDKAIPIIFGVDYRIKAVGRFANAIQIEAWKENFYATGLEIKTDFYMYGYGYDQHLKANYSFNPTYSAIGASLLFTPGAHKKRAFVTFGAGIGKYEGELEYKRKGYEIVNGQTNTFDETYHYKGDVTGYNATLGFTYVPWRIFEIETFFMGRWAKIPEITDEDGNVFRNQYNNNEKVSLDFTGFDFRLGFKFILP